MKNGCRPNKTGDEVLKDDRKRELGIDSGDPQNLSEWKEQSARMNYYIVCKVQPSVEDNRL